MECGPLEDKMVSTSSTPTFCFLLYAPDPAAGPSLLQPGSKVLNFETLLVLSVNASDGNYWFLKLCRDDPSN